MIDCKELTKNIYFYLDKELIVAEVKKIEEHLKNCTHCLGHYEFEVALQKLIKEKGRQIKMPDELKEKILSKLN